MVIQVEFSFLGVLLISIRFAGAIFVPFLMRLPFAPCKDVSFAFEIWVGVDNLSSVVHDAVT